METQNLNQSQAPESSPSGRSPEGGPKKNGLSRAAWTVVVVIILVALCLLIYLRGALPGDETAGPPLSEGDTTAVLEQELEATDLGDIDAELEALEEDLLAL